MMRMSKEVSAMSVLGQISLRVIARSAKRDEAISTTDACASETRLLRFARNDNELIAPNSHQHRGRALEVLLDGADEHGAERAVDRAVIARQRDLHLRRHRDLAVLDDRAF